MKIDGDYTFDAPQQMVWEAVLDPDVLGQIMPGGEGIAKVGEDEYAGNLKIKVGPVQGKFKGNIKLTDIVAPESYHIEVDGKGAPGFVKANGDLKLEAQGDKTYMVYTGDAKVGGRIASVGQRLVETSAKSIIRQSLELLNEYLKAQQGMGEAEAEDETDAEGTEAPKKTAVSKPAASTYTPPSQMQLAGNLAKDVLDEYVPAEYQLPTAFAAGAIFFWLLSKIFGK